MSTATDLAQIEEPSIHTPNYKTLAQDQSFSPSVQVEGSSTKIRRDLKYNDRPSLEKSTHRKNFDSDKPILSLVEEYASNGLGLADTYQHLHTEMDSSDYLVYGIPSHVNVTPQSYNGTSPSNGYSSDFEYPGINDYTTQDFDNTFLLEADFGPLPAPEDAQIIPLNSATLPVDEPASATSSVPYAVGYASRRSTGLATLSSHLMSPSLTETTSPGSGNEAPSPSMKTRLLGGGAMSRISSQSTTIEPENRHDPANHTSNTPALTSSSLEFTPEPGSRVELTSSASPVVRIESYSRGDSPSRSPSKTKHNGQKRSRANLAAPCDDSTNESDEDAFDDRGGESYQVLEMAAQTGNQSTSGERSGLDPFIRNTIADKTILNFKDQEDKAELDAKNEVVSQWLAASEAENMSTIASSSPIGARKYTFSGTPRRAKSTSGQRELAEYADGAEARWHNTFSAKIPGPGLLLDEDSGEQEEEDEDNGSFAESAPASVNGRDEIIETEQANLASDGELQPHDAYPWVDPFYVLSQESTRGQPPTSNVAMMRFIKRAADLETASRVATWGTTCRRMSEADLEKFLGRDGLLSRLSISKDKGKGKGDRRGSFMEQVEQAAARILPKRSSSHLRRKTSEPIKPYSGDTAVNGHSKKEPISNRKESLHSRKESLGSRAGSPSVVSNLKRLPSVGKKARSPKINTGSTVAAVVTHIAALGGNGSISPTAASPPIATWSSARNKFKRTARGEFHRPLLNENAEPGLVDLWNKQGGPPVPSFSSPLEDNEAELPSEPHAGAEDEADTDEPAEERGISMDFTPRNVPIIPTFDGFKINVREINPRLPPYLIDRIGQEQLRRYKKLVEFKVKHAQALQLGKCESRSHCLDNGGEPTYFPAKVNQKEIRHSHTGFSMVVQEDLDEDEEAVADGAVTAAQFPPGVPMPPVKRLPAQFECPLCFTVKKFLKPSDWSKHVHEDLQPFTCTFQACPDPKSFKRKADWVRHENERHRQLEWWTCTEDGCSHQCFRRDNFVQHLVREHKMPEPKAKTSKPNKPAVRGPAKNKSRANKETDNAGTVEDCVLTMIETCRHETTKNPSEEQCRFCGNVCNSWKKLTVHLARHMEQISMPVLELVKKRNVTPDTIVSPIEQKLPIQISASPIDTVLSNQRNSSITSPYDVPTTMHVIKQELPAQLTPVHNSIAFHAPKYNSQATGTFPWGQPKNNGSQNGASDHIQIYSRGNGSAYLSNHHDFQDSRLQQFVPCSPPASFVQPASGSGGELLYTSMADQTSLVPQSSYTPNQSYQVAIDVRQAYSNQNLQPQYMVPTSLPDSQSRQLSTDESMPIRFDPSGSLAFLQAPDGSQQYYRPQQQSFYTYPI